MSLVFPSPVTVIKSHGKKCQNDFFKIITTTTVRRHVAKMWILKKWKLSVQQEKLWILSTVRNNQGVHQTKY